MKLFTFRNISIDDEMKRVYINQQKVPLRRQEYKLLTYFVQNPERIVSKETLLDKVWGYASTILNTNTVETHMSSLRKKLAAFDWPRIITISKQGYMLE